MLSRQTALDGDGGSDLNGSYFIYLLNNDLSAADTVTASQLKGSDLYNITAVQNGFMVYDNNLTAAWYYSSLHAQPIRINLQATLDSSVAPATLDAASDNLVAALYATGSKNNTETEPNKQMSEVVIRNGQELKIYSFNKSYAFVAICGTQKLCLGDTSTLDVFDISSSKPKPLFNIQKVVAVYRTPAGIIAVRNNGILHINADKRDGYTEYSFGSYSYNYAGIKAVDNGFLLSITDKHNLKHALYIDENQPNTDSIDKKVQALADLPQVDSISVYKQYIYITPKGPTVYNPTTGTYGSDPAAQMTINQQIDNKINELGIDRNHYMIILTHQL
jgi:hypothetical protein